MSSLLLAKSELRNLSYKLLIEKRHLVYLEPIIETLLQSLSIPELGGLNSVVRSE
jgi:hypothetical protein